MNVHFEILGIVGPEADCGEKRFKLLTNDVKKITCRRCLRKLEGRGKMLLAMAAAGKRLREHRGGKATASDIDWFGGA